jgi:hypothetical protein
MLQKHRDNKRLAVSGIAVPERVLSALEIPQKRCGEETFFKPKMNHGEFRGCKSSDCKG